MSDKLLYANFAVVWLTTEVTAAQTTLTLDVGEGAMFPQPNSSDGTYFKATFEDNRTDSREIVHCIERVGDVLTLVRAQEGTTALDFPAHSTFSQRLTAGALNSMMSELGDIISTTDGDARYVNVPGDTMGGFLTLHADPVNPMHAATRQFVTAQTGSQLGDAPSDGALYGRVNQTWAKGVKLAGDTMTGDLIISKNAPSLILDMPTAGNRLIAARTAGKARMALFLAAGGEDTISGNSGSNLVAYRYADDGTTLLGTWWGVTRSTGAWGIGGAAQVGTALIVRTLGDAAYEAGITIQNVSALADAATDLRFQTGGAFSRSRIRGGKEGTTSGGFLAVSTFVGATEKDALLIDSALRSNFYGNVLINKAAPALILEYDGNTNRSIYGTQGGENLWQMQIGAASTAAPFYLYRYNAGVSALALSIDRLTGNVGVNIAPSTDIRLHVHANSTADAVVVSRGIRLLNGATLNDTSVNIEFATAGSALRGAVRGQREGATNHGALILSSALSGVSQDVLYLGSNKGSTFYGSVSVTGWTSSGGSDWGSPLYLPSSWGETIAVRGRHQSGVTAGLDIVVGTTAPKDWYFDNSGNLSAPGHIVIPQGYQFQMGAGASLSHESSGNLILTKAPGYYFGRAQASATWVWVENNVTTMSLDGSGNLWTKAALSTTYVNLPSDGLVSWASNVAYLQRSNAGHFFIQAATDWRCYWDGTDGAWRWQHTTSPGVFGYNDMTLDAGGGLSVRGVAATADPAGFRVNGVGYPGDGTSYSTLVYGEAAFGPIYHQAFHQPSVSAQHRFWINSTLFGMRNDGTAYAPGAWQDGCDERVKTDIQPITGALAKVQQIAGVTYMRTDIAPLYTPDMIAKRAAEDPDAAPLTNPPQGRHAGFLAQSVKAVLPEAITVGETPPANDPDGEGFNYLNSTAVLALVVEALKELAARVEELEGELP